VSETTTENTRITEPDALIDRAATLAADGTDADSSAEIAELAGRNRLLIEAARDRAAVRIRDMVDDWSATAALRVLNRALADLPRKDPLDWQVRWKQHRKP
jgi:hypothetical protein